MEERSVVTSAAESGAKIEERIGSLSEGGELRLGTRLSSARCLYQTLGKSRISKSTAPVDSHSRRQRRFTRDKDVTKKWPQRAQTDQENRRNTPKYPSDKLRFRLLAIPNRLC
jgi:hypothetical protein